VQKKILPRATYEQITYQIVATQQCGYTDIPIPGPLRQQRMKPKYPSRRIIFSSTYAFRCLADDLAGE